MSEELRAAADRLVTLPMFGLVESLNVHTATAVRHGALFAPVRARPHPRSHPRAQSPAQRGGRRGRLDLMADAGHDFRER